VVENEVYSWSTLCPLKDVRVVIIGDLVGRSYTNDSSWSIIGQDPYHVCSAIS
jgi:uracil DNA glycosylase